MDVAKLHAHLVAREADVPLVAQEARMLLEVLLRVVVEIGIDEVRAVLLDGDLASFGGDLEAVPGADRPGVDLAGRDDVIDRAGVLPFFELGAPVDVVDEMYFQGDPGGMSLERRAQADAAVALERHLCTPGGVRNRCIPCRSCASSCGSHRRS